MELLSSCSLIAAAVFFLTFNLGLREILEGKHLLKRFRRTEARFRKTETERLNVLLDQYRKIQKTRRQLFNQSQSLLKELQLARTEGKKLQTCNYLENNDTHELLLDLEQRRWYGEQLGADTLVDAKASLEKELKANSADRDTKEENARRLDHDHRLFVSLLEYAANRAEDDYITLFNEKEFNFSRYTVAPTRMGNVAESVRSYAQSRYSMNLDFFWTRLQKVLQGKPEYYKTLQGAKTDLDFSVSLFWLTVLSTAIWLLALPFLSRTWLPLIAVGILGPAIARIWYLVAVQNYRSFADLIRGSLDLFRLELLTDLKLALPVDSQTERKLWDSLNRRISYGENISWFTKLSECAKRKTEH